MGVNFIGVRNSKDLGEKVACSTKRTSVKESATKLNSEIYPRAIASELLGSTKGREKPSKVQGDFRRQEEREKGKLNKVHHGGISGDCSKPGTIGNMARARPAPHS